MKTFYTSYYAKSGDDPLAVQVSASAPEFFKGMSFPMLYPTWKLINAHKTGKINNEQYTQQYKDLLTSRNCTAEHIYSQLPNGAVFLCYEKSGDFCHRRIIAELFEESFGMKVVEIKDDPHVDYLSNFIII